MKPTSRIAFLRAVGISEGISFLTLVLIAMPLKYYFGFPIAVKMMGWIHGLLFILYLLAVLWAVRAMQWNFLGFIVAAGASLVPFGTFALDDSLKRKAAEIKAKT